MSKKNKKNKNKGSNFFTGNNNVNQQQMQSKPIVEQPIVIYKTQEYFTNEQNKDQIDELLTKIDEYDKSKREDADKYYNEKKINADKLETDKQKEINQAIDVAIKEKEKEMKDRIDASKQEAQKIKDDAKKEIDTLKATTKKELEDAKKEREKLDIENKELIKQQTKLESDKIAYKQIVMKEIQDDINKINEDKNKIEEENQNLHKSVKEKDLEINSIKQDKEYYEQELKSNSLRRADIKKYEIENQNLKDSNDKLSDFCKEKQKEIDSLKAQILSYGEEPKKAIERNFELEKEIEKLKDQLSNYPSEEELNQLRDTSGKFETINNILEQLKKDNEKLKDENFRLNASKTEIETYRQFIKILELQKSELQKELDRNIELYRGKVEKVFANLSEIDNNQYNHNWDKCNVNNLKELCIKFRGYMANRQKNPLYYEEKTIRTFISGFASSRLMILEGLSGTGKSSLPKAFAEFIGDEKLVDIIEVQSSWKDRNDLLGFYNDFKKQYKETKFLKALYAATSDRNNIHIIVLDEMNLSRIEYYFADFLSVLENSDVENWKMELISDYANITQNEEAWPNLIKKGKLQITDNTWFIGTANKDDSTFNITDKVYDRATVLNFYKKGEKESVAPSNPIYMDFNRFNDLLYSATKFRSDSDEKKFREMIKNIDKKIIDWFEITFGNRILNQLEKFVPVYIECGGTVEEAVDIVFSRKILRKLEGLYDENTKIALGFLKDYIQEKYPTMEISKQVIDRMISKI